jgi:phenylacetate-CoA ligase
MNWRKHIVYPLIVAKNRSNELRYLRDLRDRERIPRAERELATLQRLRRLLEHAKEHVPYYRQVLGALDFKPESMTGPPGLAGLPVLTKRIIQEHLEELVSESADRAKLIRDKTGGSTASPLVFYYDEDRLDWRKAAEQRHNEWAGVELGMKGAALWGARRDIAGAPTLRGRLRTFLTSNLRVLDASSITDAAFDSFIDELNRFRPDYILAYAQVLGYFARYIRDNGRRVPAPGVIITSAETLAPADRALIEEVFRSRVFDRYGCREVSVIASECEAHTMHINDDGLHLEFVRDDGTPCRPGEPGRILVTDLLNRAMPLVRYEIGDMGAPIDTACPCGRTLPAMKMAMGRVTDFILTPAGRKVSGSAITAYVITNIEGLGRVQIYQREQRAIEVKVVPNARFGPDTLRLLEERMRAFLDNIEPVFEVVDEIPVPESGKMQFCVNELLRGRV